MKRKRFRTESIDFQHRLNKNAPDHPIKPFIRSFALHEEEPDDKEPGSAILPHLYGCAINPFVPEDQDQIGVVVGLRYVFLYRLPVRLPEIRKISQMTINVSADKETLHTVTWCMDPLDPGKEHKIVTGGQNRVLYVINASTLEIDRELIGHTHDINDVRTCPTNPSMVVTSSKDHTVRVFHIREETCLLLFGGVAGHKDTVVSSDWSFDGMSIMSGGFDQKIVTWELTNPRVADHLKKCLDEIEAGKPLGSFVPDLESLERLHSGEAFVDIQGHTLITNRPDHSIKDVHFDTVDCIRSIELDNKNYILSKSVGHERCIKLWRNGLIDSNKSSHHPDEGINQTFVEFWSKTIEHWQFYFSKLAIDPLRKWVAVTTSTGMLNFYKLFERKIEKSSSSPEKKIKRKNKKKKKRFLFLKLDTPQAHDVSFSRNGQILLCVCDEGLVVRLDRVHKNTQKEPEDLWYRPIS